MILTNNSLYKYNPNEMSQGDFLEKFVVRLDTFDNIFKDIKSTNYKTKQQHYMIVGESGQGKTTILRKLQLEVLNDYALSKFLIPIKFPEDMYNVRNLAKLWEEVADILQYNYGDIFPDIYDNLEKYFEDDDYFLKAFGYLEKKLKKKEKKLILFLDNIDKLLGKLKPKEKQQLREILLNSSSFRIIGTSTKMFKLQCDYSKPFYEFFKIIKLDGLDFEQSKQLILSLGNEEQKKHIQKILYNKPQKLESLIILTLGVPRTLVMLYEIFLDGNRDVFNDLLKILDEMTPLYQHRMDDLPTILQDIMHTLAMNWDGMLTSEIAKKTKIESKSVSSQLKQLEKYEIVESIKTGKNKIYMIKERLFNIWYLVKFNRKDDRDKVEWLVQFLNNWYSRDEIEKREKKLINYVQDGNSYNGYSFFICESLDYAGLDMSIEHNVENIVREYRDTNESSLSKNIEEPDIEFIKQLLRLQKSGRNNEKNELLLRYDKNNEDILHLKAIIHYNKGEYEISIKILKGLVSKNSKDITVFDLLLKVLYEQRLFDKETLEIAMQAYNVEKKDSSIKIIIAHYLSIGKIEESYPLFEEFLNIKNQPTNCIKDYLLTLIIFKKYHKTKEFLELPKHNLKEKFKIIWYALMYFMQDEYPNEYKKMGSELKQIVKEVIKILIKLH